MSKLLVSDGWYTPSEHKCGTPVFSCAHTIGGFENRPAGRFTVTRLTVFALSGVISTLPLTMRPDMTPFRPIVSGPQCPDPSPRTRKVPDADSNTDDSAPGKLFVSDGEFVEAQ